MEGMRLTLPLLAPLAVVAACGGQTSPPPSPPVTSSVTSVTPPVSTTTPSACEIDLNAPMDCSAICAHYASGFAKVQHEGEVMTPEGCPQHCQAVSSPPVAKAAVGIHWRCMTKHDVCSKGAHECESTCRVSAGLAPLGPFVEPCKLGGPGA
jgi:hypothetical protein